MLSLLAFRRVISMMKGGKDRQDIRKFMGSGDISARLT